MLAHLQALTTRNCRVSKTLHSFYITFGVSALKRTCVCARACVCVCVCAVQIAHKLSMRCETNFHCANGHNAQGKIITKEHQQQTASLCFKFCNNLIAGALLFVPLWIFCLMCSHLTSCNDKTSQNNKQEVPDIFGNGHLATFRGQCSNLGYIPPMSPLNTQKVSYCQFLPIANVMGLHAQCRAPPADSCPQPSPPVP